MKAGADDDDALPETTLKPKDVGPVRMSFPPLSDMVGGAVTLTNTSMGLESGYIVANPGANGANALVVNWTGESAGSAVGRTVYW